MDKNELRYWNDIITDQLTDIKDYSLTNTSVLNDNLSISATPTPNTPPQPTVFIKNNSIYLDDIFNKIKGVFINKTEGITTIVWNDGTHTSVKRTKGDKDNEHTALAYAILKKLNKGSNGYLRQFDKLIANAKIIKSKDKKAKNNDKQN